LDNIISIQGLYKIFGPEPERALLKVKEAQEKKTLRESTNHVVALNDISLEIRRGEMFVVMGLSGSGKSTLLRCINRLVEPTAGTITIDGTEITSLPKKDLLHLRSKKLGMVFQHYALLPHRNVLDNVAFGLEIQGESLGVRHEKALESLKLVGLEDWVKAMPSQLSGGMQQRVGLARALSLNPPVLLMDEPFSGLDPLIRKEMQRELIRLQDKLKITLVFITHDLDEALTLGDRICILKNGRLEQEGVPEEIVLSPASEYVKSFVQDVDTLKVLPAERIMETDLSIFYLDGEVNTRILEEEERDKPIFIVNGDRYVGALSLEKLKIVAKEGKKAIRDQLPQKAPCIGPREPVCKAIEMLMWSPHVVGVTNDDNKLIGAITRDSFVSFLESQKG